VWADSRICARILDWSGLLSGKNSISSAERSSWFFARGGDERRLYSGRASARATDSSFP
jgi:hypothetical protein